MDNSVDLSTIDRVIQALRAWLSETDHHSLVVALGVLLIVVLLRRPLAAAATRLLAWTFGTLSIKLSETVLNEIGAALRVIIVAAAAVLALEAMQLPDMYGGILRRILISVLVLAVFAAWYRLIDPLIAVLDPEKFSDLKVDTRWVIRLGQFVVALLGITAVLAVWDIDISSALTGVGVFGAGLAIAAQDLVRNLFAGMANMSEKRFGPGDWIAVDGGIEGTVSRVDVRSTTVLGFDRVPRYVPNADLSNAVVLNKSRMDHRRVLWTIPLVLDATDAQVEQVCASLVEHLETSGDFIDDGSLLMLVMPVGLSDSAVDIMIYAFTKTNGYQPYLDVCARLTLAIRRAVADADTELAYPTQTVVLRR